MEATLPSIRELTAAGDSLMWIAGPGDMASENTSQGIREPLAQGNEITIQANNWRFHLDAGQVNPEDRGNNAVMQSSRLDWGKRNGLAWTEGDPIGDWNNCPEVESIPGKHGGDWLLSEPCCRCIPSLRTWLGDLPSTTSWDDSTPWRNQT